MGGTLMSYAHESSDPDDVKRAVMRETCPDTAPLLVRCSRGEMAKLRPALPRGLSILSRGRLSRKERTQVSFASLSDSKNESIIKEFFMFDQHRQCAVDCVSGAIPKFGFWPISPCRLSCCTGVVHRLWGIIAEGPYTRANSKGL